MREQQSKATQERHERMLNALFQISGNDRCADCTAKNPRWASYSLGVFLCIRCGSLHRKMGTHISKVKSVSMDRWTLQEIQHMTKLGGNSVINRQINTNPQKHPLPIALDDDHAMERYVRDKWEKRLFQEEENTNTITGLQQIGDSSTSLATTTSTVSTNLTIENYPSYQPQQQHITTTSDMMHNTPSSQSSISSSPSIQQQVLAGRVSPSTSSTTNPFMMTNQKSTSYNPFSTSSTTSSAVMTPPPSNSNPFIISNQPLQQSPFDIHYNPSSYFTEKGSNNNPFLLQ